MTDAAATRSTPAQRFAGRVWAAALVLGLVLGIWFMASGDGWFGLGAGVVAGLLLGLVVNFVIGALSVGNRLHDRLNG